MTYSQIIASVIIVVMLLVVGGLTIARIPAHDVITALLNPLKKREMKRRKLDRLTGKSPKFIRRMIADVELLIRGSGDKTLADKYFLVSAVGAILGLVIGLAIDNVFFGAVLVIAFLILPYTALRVKADKNVRKVVSELEIALSTITNNYILTGDIIKSAQNTMEYLPPILQGIMKEFIVDVTLVNANVAVGIERMKQKIQNSFWREWCDALIMCQNDKQLRYALPAIVARLCDVKRMQMESYAKMQSNIRIFAFMIIIVIGLIIMLATSMPGWYEMMQGHILGKAAIAAGAALMLVALVLAVRINRPTEAK